MNTAFPIRKLSRSLAWILLVSTAAKAISAVPETNSPAGRATLESQVGQALRAIYRNPRNLSNVVESVQVIQSAAEQGLPLAEYDLAVCYDSGLGVPHDEKRAVSLYEKAARKGLAAAQFDLALSYLSAGQ